jgi:hypothetical protein
VCKLGSLCLVLQLDEGVSIAVIIINQAGQGPRGTFSAQRVRSEKRRARRAFLT